MDGTVVTIYNKRVVKNDIKYENYIGQDGKYHCSLCWYYCNKKDRFIEHMNSESHMEKYEKIKSTKSKKHSAVYKPWLNRRG